MITKLKVKVARRPDPDALLATRQIRPSRYLLRKVFGRSRPRHKMALAEAVGVAKGGEAK